MSVTEVEQKQGVLSREQRIAISNELSEHTDPTLWLLAYFIVDPEDISQTNLGKMPRPQQANRLDELANRVIDEMRDDPDITRTAHVRHGRGKLSFWYRGLDPATVVLIQDEILHQSVKRNQFLDMVLTTDPNFRKHFLQLQEIVNPARIDYIPRRLSELEKLIQAKNRYRAKAPFGATDDTSDENRLSNSRLLNRILYTLEDEEMKLSDIKTVDTSTETELIGLGKRITTETVLKWSKATGPFAVRMEDQSGGTTTLQIDPGDLQKEDFSCIYEVDPKHMFRDYFRVIVKGADIIPDLFTLQEILQQFNSEAGVSNDRLLEIYASPDRLAQYLVDLAYFELRYLIANNIHTTNKSQLIGSSPSQVLLSQDLGDRLVGIFEYCRWRLIMYLYEHPQTNWENLSVDLRSIVLHEQTSPGPSKGFTATMLDTLKRLREVTNSLKLIGGNNSLVRHLMPSEMIADLSYGSTPLELFAEMLDLKIYAEGNPWQLFKLGELEIRPKDISPTDYQEQKTDLLFPGVRISTYKPYAISENTETGEKFVDLYSPPGQELAHFAVETAGGETLVRGQDYIVERSTKYGFYRLRILNADITDPLKVAFRANNEVNPKITQLTEIELAEDKLNDICDQLDQEGYYALALRIRKRIDIAHKRQERFTSTDLKLAIREGMEYGIPEINQTGAADSFSFLSVNEDQGKIVGVCSDAAMLAQMILNQAAPDYQGGFYDSKLMVPNIFAPISLPLGIKPYGLLHADVRLKDGTLSFQDDMTPTKQDGSLTFRAMIKEVMKHMGASFRNRMAADPDGTSLAAKAYSIEAEIADTYALATTAYPELTAKVKAEHIIRAGSLDILGSDQSKQEYPEKLRRELVKIAFENLAALDQPEAKVSLVAKILRLVEYVKEYGPLAILNNPDLSKVADTIIEEALTEGEQNFDHYKRQVYTSNELYKLDREKQRIYLEYFKGSPAKFATLIEVAAHIKAILHKAAAFSQ